MYYVIEAIHRDRDGELSHVRWHAVTVDGAQSPQHGPSEVVPVVDAAERCKSSEVRVYADGHTGQFFKMKACEHGLDAEDPAGVPLGQRLAHLPTFEPGLSA